MGWVVDCPCKRDIKLLMLEDGGGTVDLCELRSGSRSRRFLEDVNGGSGLGEKDIISAYRDGLEISVSPPSDVF